MLGKQELELFEKVCSLCININQIPKELFFLHDSIKPLLNSLSIDFESLQTLQSLGLFLPNDMSRSIENPDKKNFEVNYLEKVIRLKPTHETNFKIALPAFYGLSNTGQQILKHLNPEFREEYYLWLKTNYKIPNYILNEG